MSVQKEFKVFIAQKRQSIMIQKTITIDPNPEYNSTVQKVYLLYNGNRVAQENYQKYCQRFWKFWKCRWLSCGYLDRRGVRHEVRNLDVKSDYLGTPTIGGFYPGPTNT